jgi:hypothetical protein
MCSKGVAGSPGSSSGMQEQLLVSSFGSHDSVCKPDLPPGKHMPPQRKDLPSLKVRRGSDILFRGFFALISFPDLSVILLQDLLLAYCIFSIFTTCIAPKNFNVSPKKLKSENTLHMLF